MGASLQVLFIPFHCPPAGGRSPVQRKRRGVWENWPRNARIADVAMGMVTRPKATLRRFGVSAADVLPGVRRPLVAVLAETAGHADRLEAVLPDWLMLTAPPVTTYPDGYEPEVPSADAEPPPGRVLTLMYAARYGVGCDVLVRATGGTGPLDWACVRGRENRRGTTPALVIDIGDQDGRQQHPDAAGRRREYREQGLRILSAAPARTA
jgi:hypothetical protein